jgi:hypothetical protein
MGKKTRIVAIAALAAATVAVVAAATWSSAPVGEGKTVRVMMTPT